MTGRPNSGPWRTACLAHVSVFLLLTAAVLVLGMLPGEVALREAILVGSPEWLAGALGWFNYAGSWQVVGPGLVALLAVSADARRRWWLWCAALLLVGVGEVGGKFLVGRPRPEGVASGFPSGHAAAVAYAAMIAVYLTGRSACGTARRVTVQALAGLLVLTVGLARIVLRAHWPADVLGGMALGTACAAAAAWWDAARPVPDVLSADRPAPATPAPVDRVS